MRLVDVDKITVDTFKAYVGENGGFISFGDAVDAIEAMPTAYDIDKVVDEIETFGGCVECRAKGTDKRFYYGMGCKACVFGRIVDIVKRGGTNEIG